MSLDFLTSNLVQWLIRNSYEIESSDDEAYDYFLEEMHELANTILKRVGNQLDKEPRRLGYGAWAEVYWLQDRKKVLKLTTDESDAFAAEIVRRKPDRGLVKTYDVFAVPESSLYGIVAEKLVDAAGSERKRWDIVADTLESEPRLRPFTMTLTWYEKKFLPFLAWVKTRPSLVKYFDESTASQIYSWCEELTKRRIIWRDMQSENIRFRGRQPVILDLGASKVPSQRIPLLQVSYLEDD